jgi:phosphohistidine phosphatase
VQPRRLVLIRHAQAAGAPRDRDRPLTPQGARRAAAIGSWLERSGSVPDRVLVSPAIRAAQTWAAAASRVQGPQPTVDDRIYDNTVEALLAVLGELPDDVRTVAVVGHNPSIGTLAGALDDGLGDASARADLRGGFPTGAVAVFVVPGPFADLTAGAATLTEYAVPAD